MPAIHKHTLGHKPLLGAAGTVPGQPFAAGWQVGDAGLVVWYFATGEPYALELVWTGEEPPAGHTRHVGTVQDPRGLVWHLFAKPA